MKRVGWLLNVFIGSCVILFRPPEKYLYQVY